MADRKVKRPKKVKVGYLTYSIQYLDHMEWPTHEHGAMGVTYPNQGRILIRLNDEDTKTQDQVYNETELKQVLVHEIMHACYHVSNLTSIVKADIPQDDREETEIATLTPTLFAVLRDNPKVLLYLVTG